MTQDSDRQAGGNWKGYLQIAAIAVVIIAAVYFARAPGQIEITGDPEQADQKPVVHVLQPELTSQAIDLQLTGSVGLKDRVTVSSEVVGRVAWVSPMFEPGGTIKANEVFIRIDPAEYELRVREAMIQQQLAEEAMQLPGRPQSISQNLLELAEVTMELAELQLSRTEISLPYPIRVISSSVEVGEVAGPADTAGRTAVLGVGYRPDSIRVTVPAEPLDVEYLHPVIGRAVQVSAGGRIFPATVASMSPVLAQRSRLATLHMKFDESVAVDDYPLPNTFVEVTIAGPEHSDVFVLPESAEQGLGRAWLVRDSALESVVVEPVGRTRDGWVVKAFDAGDGVVVDAIPNAREGQEVTAITPGG